MKYYVNDVNLADGDETVLHGTTSFQTYYDHDGVLSITDALDLDFVIEIEHTALLEMIEKANAGEEQEVL